VAKDEAGAAALFERACDGNKAEACATLGAVYETGEGVAKKTRALAFYQKACRTGLKKACDDAARLQ
jgi:TPR repeat protein